ncbi:MAG TPA: lamin tail domain-containing protein [Methanothrix sp.]|nr:lamin tail domain-containing protein [Methanothrix sp.]
MRCFSAMILLAVLLTFSAGPMQAQDVLSSNNSTNATNATEVVAAQPIANATAEPAVEAIAALAVTAEPAVEEAAPVEEAAAVEDAASVEEVAAAPAESKFTQLSEYVPSGYTVLGSAEAPTNVDVSQTANTAATFTRDAGEASPAVKVLITSVGTGDDKYVEVANKAVGEWDISGWTLASAGNSTFTFPTLTLDEGTSVRVHEGEGAGSETDIYTNSSSPLWIDNLVSLQDAEGDVISTYDISAAPAASAWVDPLAKLIQY